MFIDFFLGRGNPGTFSWSDGTEFSSSFTKWYRGRLEPRGARSKHVVISEIGYWEGVDPQSDVRHGYVCEYDSKYNRDGMFCLAILFAHSVKALLSDRIVSLIV